MTKEENIVKNADSLFGITPKPVVSVLITKKRENINATKEQMNLLKIIGCYPEALCVFEETAEEAVKRETKEETGLDVKIEGIIGIYRIDNDPRGMHVDIIYKGKAGGKIKLSQEDGKYKYFAKTNYLNILLINIKTQLRIGLKKTTKYG